LTTKEIVVTILILGIPNKVENSIIENNTII
jgi:hypothetical protein